LSLLLSACAAFERTDIPGTQIAENIIYGTEVSSLGLTAIAEQATHIAEIDVLMTEVAVVNGVNTQLLGTLQAIITPTPVLIEDDSVELASLPSSVQGSRLYVGTGVTDAVDSNGCITRRRISFDPGVQIIYATLVIYNLTVDTVIAVEWYRGDSLIFSDSWVSTENNPLLCLWFELNPGRVQLLPGEWRVLAYADGFPAINPMVFIINGEPPSP
jgi:exosortase/archaeosortase